MVTRSFPSVFIPVGILILQMQIAEGKWNSTISTGYIIRAGDTIVVWKNVAVFHEVRVDVLIWCVFFNLYLLCKHAFDKVFAGQRFDFPFQCIYRFPEYDQKSVI